MKNAIEMNNISSLLESIAGEALKIGVNLDRALRPGASSQHINSEMSKLVFPLPQGVIEMYGWRNGVWPEGQNFEIRLFPMYFFPPIEVSTETHTNFTRKLAEWPGDWWNVDWFPLFTDGAGEYFVINLNPSHTEYLRILGVHEGRGVTIAFWTLETMLESILQCYREGAYSTDEDGFLDDNYEMSSAIYRRFDHGFNP